MGGLALAMQPGILFARGEERNFIYLGGGGGLVELMRVGVCDGLII